jgi:phage host-nuclease inhibitor protein Gam
MSKDFLETLFKKVSKATPKTDKNLADLSEVNVVLGHIAVRKAQLEQLSGQLDQEVLQLTQKYVGQAEEVALTIRAMEVQVENFMEINKSTLLKDGCKSVQVANGEIGWRKNPDRLQLPTGLDEQEICKLLGMHGLDEYVRTEPSVRKERVKEDFDKPDFSFEELGFKLARGREVFYIKPMTLELKRKVA